MWNAVRRRGLPLSKAPRSDGAGVARSFAPGFYAGRLVSSWTNSSASIPKGTSASPARAWALNHRHAVALDTNPHASKTPYTPCRAPKFKLTRRELRVNHFHGAQNVRQVTRLRERRRTTRRNEKNRFPGGDELPRRGRACPTRPADGGTLGAASRAPTFPKARRLTGRTPRRPVPTTTPTAPLLAGWASGEKGTRNDGQVTRLRPPAAGSRKT